MSLYPALISVEGCASWSGEPSWAAVHISEFMAGFNSSYWPNPAARWGCHSQVTGDNGVQEASRS